MRSRSSSSARSKPSSRIWSAFLATSAVQMGLQVIKQRFEPLEPHRFLEGAGHVQAQRFAKAECRFEHPAVESADNQDRGAIIFTRKETQQFDAVHSGHAEVQSHHVGMIYAEFVAKLAVLGGDNGIESALTGGTGEELGQDRLIVYQQQARLIQYALPLCPTPA